LIIPLLTTPSQVRVHTAQPSESADLSRSDALQGTTAEDVKASFEAHRAATPEQRASPASSPASETAPSSIALIQDIRSTLDKLSADFFFPPSLEFTDNEEDGLAYSPINTPVRLYEHALDDLLVQLDAVESDGDGEVRELRRAAIKEVERAIEDVERRVREAREVTKEGSKDGAKVATAASGSEVDITTQDYNVVAESEYGVETKPQENGPSPPTSDGDLLVSSSVPLSARDIDVASSHDTTSAPPAPDTDTVALKEAGPIPVSLPDAITAPTRSPTTEVPVDVSESTHETVTERASSAPPEASPSAGSAEFLPEFATPVLEAITPSLPPISPARPSSVLPEPEDVSSSLNYDRLSAPPKPEGDDNEWTEVEA
jgi:BAG domain